MPVTPLLLFWPLQVVLVLLVLVVLLLLLCLPLLCRYYAYPRFIAHLSSNLWCLLPAAIHGTGRKVAGQRSKRGIPHPLVCAPTRAAGEPPLGGPRSRLGGLL